jgi:hypothetical protein
MTKTRQWPAIDCRLASPPIFFGAGNGLNRAIIAKRPANRDRKLQRENKMKDNLGKLLYFLTRLNEVHISYSLGQIREEAIMVSIIVPEQHWEVEFFEDGSVEIEIFKSDGEIYDEKMLDELFDKFSD